MSKRAREDDELIQQTNKAFECINLLYDRTKTNHENHHTETLQASQTLTSYVEQFKNRILQSNEILFQYESEIEELKQKEKKETKKINALQDFLVNEIAQTEKLEADIRSMKENLMAVTKNRDFYKQKCESQIEELKEISAKSAIKPSGGTSHDTNIAPVLLSQSLLGKYIVKDFGKYGYFYGVIVSYAKPWYKVIYQDGDAEDMTRSEAEQHLVHDSDVSNIDPKIIDDIKEIAEQYDMENPERNYRGIIDVPPGSDDDIQVVTVDSNEGNVVDSTTRSESENLDVTPHTTNGDTGDASVEVARSETQVNGVVDDASQHVLFRS
mmetsp:Transcript_7363/g.10944  ORF Transcript_7363/g.10944 Transcript_7363/m.10944 type:complete len:325 (-) Transcript_7363:113-1087(-)